jgi:branched-subunit amino acid ABC-type transport system permease component
LIGLVALITGLADGMLLFLVASGLTLILGVMGVVNFAHGGFFMLGAFGTYAILGGKDVSVPVFLIAILAVAVIVGLLGIVAERYAYRLLYDLPQEISLLGTYALLLVIVGMAQWIWGVAPVTVSRPAGLGGSVTIAGVPITTYGLLIIAVGLVCAAFLEILVRRTGFGHRLTAVAEDRTMAALLGIRVTRVFAATFAIGVALAAIGGGLAAPTLSLVPDVALAFILQAFAIVIIGGFGSIAGSLIAAVGLGILNSALTLYAPTLSAFSLYILMVVVLVARPQGLFGSAYHARESL